MSRPCSLSERERDLFWRDVEWLYSKRDEAALRAKAETLAPSDVYALVDGALSQDERWAEDHLRLTIVRAFNQRLTRVEASTPQEDGQMKQWLDEVVQTQPAYLRYALGVLLCQLSDFRPWAPVVVASLPARERFILLSLPHLWPDTLEAAAEFEPLYALLDDAQRTTLAAKVFTDAGHVADSRLLPAALERARSWNYEPTDQNWSKVLFNVFVDQRPWLGEVVDAHRHLVGATAMYCVDMEEPELGDRLAATHASDEELPTLLDTLRAAHERVGQSSNCDLPDDPFPLTAQRVLAVQRRQLAADVPVGDQPRRPRARA